MHPFEDLGVDAAQRVVAAALAELGDVRAGRERAALADDQNDFRVVLDGGARLVQRGDELAVDGVAHLGPVEPPHDPVLALLDEQA